MADMINNPQHYQQASVPLEPIDILRYAPFDLGNTLKYILRAGHKGDAKQDWEKARKYCEWTSDSYRMNPEPYDNFFEHYGLLLYKFKAFDCSEFESVFNYFDDFITYLERIINKNL